jgi:hypothetical protein
MKHISSFCTKGICLEHGTINFTGDIKETIRAYSHHSLTADGIVRISHPEFIFNGIQNKDDLKTRRVNDDLEIFFQFSPKNFRSEDIFFDVGIYNANGEMVIHSRTRYNGNPFSIQENKDFLIRYYVKSPDLAPGNYYLTLFVYEEKYEQKTLFWMDDFPLCTVSPDNPYSNTSGISTLSDIKSVTYPFNSFEMLC